MAARGDSDTPCPSVSSLKAASRTLERWVAIGQGSALVRLRVKAVLAGEAGYKRTGGAFPWLPGCQSKGLPRVRLAFLPACLMLARQ